MRGRRIPRERGLVQLDGLWKDDAWIKICTILTTSTSRGDIQPEVAITGVQDDRHPIMDSEGENSELRYFRLT